MSSPIDPRRIEIIDDATVEMFRAKTGAERVAQGLAMFDFAVEVLTTSVRSQHPDWPAQLIEAEVGRRLHGNAA